MAIESMNEYRITHENGESEIAVCVTAREAIEAFDTVLSPVTQLVRTRIGLQVSVPDAALTVNFRTEISGSGAELAGCRATPSTYEIADGSTVIFEAFAAEGYNFVGWFIGTNIAGAPESTATIASIVINAELGVSQDIIITAVFAPVA